MNLERITMINTYSVPVTKTNLVAESARLMAEITASDSIIKIAKKVPPCSLKHRILVLMSREENHSGLSAKELIELPELANFKTTSIGVSLSQLTKLSLTEHTSKNRRIAYKISTLGGELVKHIKDTFNQLK